MNATIRKLLAATCASGALLAAAPATQAQALKLPLPPAVTSLPGGLGAKYGCPWLAGNDVDTNNTGYVDVAASYRAAAIPVSVPAGAYIRIRGRFPQVRFLSFQTYDGFRPGNTIDFLADALIQSDAGGALDPNPAVLPLTNDYTAEYTLRVVYEDVPTPPAVRQQNVLYAGRGSNLAAISKQIGMRLYLPNPMTDRLGNTPLPKLTYVGPDGGEIDLDNSPDLPRCKLVETLEQANILFPTAAIPPSPKTLAFHPPKGSTTLLFYPNPDGRYLRATVVKSYGDLVVMRQRAQSTPALPPLLTPAPQTRYWSVCMNSVFNSRVTGCHADRDTRLQDDGYFVTVISRAADRPALAYPEFGYNWLEYGPQALGLVLLRQILPDPNFEGNYRFAEAQPDAPVAQTIGSWAPDITYCDRATFAAMAGSGGAALMAACKASVGVAP